LESRSGNGVFSDGGALPASNVFVFSLDEVAGNAAPFALVNLA